jgi:hypothetical protein
MSMSNPATAGTPLLNAPVSVPANIEQLVTSIGGPTAGTAPVSFSTSGPAFGIGSPSTFGVDNVVNLQTQNLNNQQPPCVSGGGDQQNCQQGPQ